ncbi:alpha beta hydrolase [Moniliophthora roreri MCA 2997]|uniref:Alpha beta hydrolase n=1 Tax=Moniliophthora roreri (strain MCA 2997) TaxID=1381753 RepID=V2YEA0_MONRO|nr:alpha beta hydrolase [Moniliophthora roreri MCA 2997]KAI3609011.1 alpha beta hydrolase [Moniliophthora roreri]
MPFVNVQTATGNVRYNYTICTPTSTDASSLEPNLPTVLFIHTILTTQIIFHSQFADPRLRRFNLVAFDTREHGETVGEHIPLKYDEVDAMEDTVKFLDAISLPPCHICGLGSGTTVALQLALKHPTRVLSLTFFSPLCIEEPPEVTEGFGEVFGRWTSALPDADTVDEELLQEAFMGLAEYAFTNIESASKLALTIGWYINECNRRRWTYEKLGACKMLIMDFMANRKGHTTSELAQITCPIVLVTAGNGVGYPSDFAERFHKQLETAKVRVSTVNIPNAPHFMCVDYGDIINPLLYDQVMSQIASDSASLPAIQQAALVHSPWHNQLKAAGWDGSEDDGMYYI